ncbi:MAG TPA: hypothetical protein ENI23_14060 [bacterium]|nr:hypothetical protein [bacterium]
MSRIILPGDQGFSQEDARKIEQYANKLQRDIFETIVHRTIFNREKMTDCIQQLGQFLIDAGNKLEEITFLDISASAMMIVPGSVTLLKEKAIGIIVMFAILCRDATSVTFEEYMGFGQSLDMILEFQMVMSAVTHGIQVVPNAVRLDKTQKFS